MAAVSVTAANVTTSDKTVELAQLGAATTVTAGQHVYKDTDGTFKLMQADGTDIESGVGSDKLGCTLGAGSPNQLVAILTGGTLNCGGTLIVGSPYFIHTTAGAFGLFAELSSTNYVTQIGFGTTATASNSLLALAYNPTGLRI